ncbi:MAG: tetratricopeptide repeat protein [Alphaproteobacteria bacterium]
MTLRQLKSTTALLCILLTITACSSPEEKEARHIKRGNELFEDQQYAKARVEYKNALKLKPLNPEPLFRIGLVDEAEGNFRNAYIIFTRTEQQDAHFHPALLKLAGYYIAGSQENEAKKRIGMVLADDPNNAEAHALNAAILLRAKDTDGAEKEARFALSKDPANVTAFSVLAGIFVQKGDDAKAIATIEDGISRNPKNLPLAVLKAGLYQKANDWPKLADAYETIFKLAPTETRYRLRLAEIYIKAGKINEAEAVLRDGTKKLPDDWELKHQLVLFLATTRGLDAAEKEIKAYQTEYSDHNEVTGWLADLYISHNNFDKAVALLNDVVSKNNFDKEGLNARTTLARIYYAKGNRAEAEKLTTEVLSHDQNNLDALFIRARMTYDQGLYEKAILDLRSILRDRPKTKEAIKLLSEVHYVQGHNDLAIETLNQYTDLDPLDYAAQVRLAQLYHTNGDSKHAMSILFLATKAEPKYPPVWETTARIAIDTKDWETAAKAIDNLDALEGQHMVALFLRGQLADHNGKTDEAITNYTQVITDNASSQLGQRALLALIDAYKRQNRLDTAVQYLEGLKEKSAFVHNVLGDVYLLVNKQDLAAASYDAAIAASPERPEAFLQRAKIYVADKKYDPALDLLKKAATLAPGDLRAPVMQGEIYTRVGRYDDALSTYDAILKQNPELTPVANNYAAIVADYKYTDKELLEKARLIAERFIATQNAILMDTLAWVYYRQDNIPQALTMIERAIGLDAKAPPQLRYHYGAILAKAGKDAEAKTQLQQATVAGADYPGLDEARKLLAGL